MSWYFFKTDCECDNYDSDCGCASCIYDSVCPHSDRELRMEYFKQLKENDEYYRLENG